MGNTVIEFVEKEPVTYNRNNLFSEVSIEIYIPTYFIKDGKEYFAFNRAWWCNEMGVETGNNVSKVEQFRKEIIHANGAYIRYKGPYEDPLDMLADSAERQFHIVSTGDVIKDGESDIYFDGCQDGVFDSLFTYRIYDDELIYRIKTIVKLLEEDDWDEAKEEIAAARQKTGLPGSAPGFDFDEMIKEG